jgi:hypothetical protein
MAPRRTRQEINQLLGRAAAEAEHAEAYHAAAADPGALTGQSVRQAVRDAAAMQLIELAGCAEGFIRDRGEPGTTLARLDDALRPVVDLRTVHTHPERVPVPQPIAPAHLGGMIKQLKQAIVNLDSETVKFEARGQVRALNGIYAGVIRIEKDGLPEPAALRPRDLHYAGYYREIQFGRLAKATGLYDSWISPDPRRVDVNRSIFDADDMAHKFHVMRGGADKSVLPVSVVSPEHDDRVPGRKLSGLMRELRHEFQNLEERLEEVAISSMAMAREEYRDAVRGLAQQYAQMMGDPPAATAIYDYVQQQPRLDREMIEAMRRALQAAADPAGDYGAVSEAVGNRCLELCFALEGQGDQRLIGILDAADRRSRPGVIDAAGRKPVDAGTGNAPSPAGAAQPGAEENDPYPAGTLTADETGVKNNPGYSRWTGEPLGEAAGVTQSAGKGQSHR